VLAPWTLVPGKWIVRIALLCCNTLSFRKPSQIWH
jgi:hypothetical protein